MSIQNFTIVELSACIVSVLGALAVCIKVIFNSRCSKIDMCCMHLKRDVIPANQIVDNTNTNNP